MVGKLQVYERVSFRSLKSFVEVCLSSKINFFQSLKFSFQNFISSFFTFSTKQALCHVAISIREFQRNYNLRTINFSALHTIEKL